MPLILVIGGLLVSSLFGVASVLDKVDNIKNDSQSGGLINAGSIALIVVGGLAVWYVTKKK